ncbi:hypothetical protein R3P38DRAFT_1505659 [Favolaschia claudopus]|uniref:Zn(2)-C6 fungal-type domain-containing protein n=1 Tax=Favolaschia claudopus TaxID=2862362 RepID=A0AAW0AJ94_9AGAR
MSQIPTRRTRAYLACSACRSRKVKCLTSDMQNKPCQRCVQRGLQCEYVLVADEQKSSSGTSRGESSSPLITNQSPSLQLTSVSPPPSPATRSYGKRNLPVPTLPPYAWTAVPVNPTSRSFGPVPSAQVENSTRQSGPKSDRDAASIPDRRRSYESQHLPGNSAPDSPSRVKRLKNLIHE